MHIFFSKNPNFFASTRPPASFYMAKLTRTKQLIDCGLSSRRKIKTRSSKQSASVTISRSVPSSSSSKVSSEYSSKLLWGLGWKSTAGIVSALLLLWMPFQWVVSLDIFQWVSQNAICCCLMLPYIRTQNRILSLTNH